MKISQVALKLDIFRILNNNSVSMVSVCLPSDALLQHLPSYLGFSYLGHGVAPPSRRPGLGRGAAPLSSVRRLPPPPVLNEDKSL